jgi:hypothetical protein
VKLVSEGTELALDRGGDVTGLVRALVVIVCRCPGQRVGTGDQGQLDGHYGGVEVRAAYWAALRGCGHG